MTPEELARLTQVEAGLNAVSKRLSLLEQRPPPNTPTPAAVAELDRRLTLLEQRPMAPPPEGAEPLPPAADLSGDPDAFLEMPTEV